nr:putative ribonuclease H-like domain-containing protein [Tanacetum cinerariifolium]
YNLSSKKVEETLNLRYLEDKPNVQGLGQAWYFDLDYLTDSLGYTRFKTNTHVGTQDTNINAGTQDDDSKSECDEQAILVPSFPSNSFLGPKYNTVFAPMENHLDYAEELARLQRQEHEAHSAAAKYGFEFSNETAEMLHQVEIETYRNLVLAAGDPTGIVSTGGVPAGSISASSVPASNVLTSSVPASNVPASSVPAGGVLAGSVDYAGFGDPADSEYVPAIFNPYLADNSTLPPGHLLGSSEHSTRFPSPSDLGNHQPKASIFSSSSYDDDFFADVTNLVSSVVVDPVVTKRVYVDDIIFGSTNKAWCDEFEVLMKGEFEMSAIKSVRTTTTPYEVPKPKSKDEPDDVNVHLYRSMIGSLMYLTASRPDIMFAVSACSRH